MSLKDLARNHSYTYFGPLRIEQPHLQLDNLDRPGKGGENPSSPTFASARPCTSLLAYLQLVVKRLVVQGQTRRLLWEVTFSQDQTGPMWEDDVHVMFPGFSFLIWDPVQVGEGADSGGDRGLLDGEASVPSMVMSRSVLLERVD